MTTMTMPHPFSKVKWLINDRNQPLPSSIYGSVERARNFYWWLTDDVLCASARVCRVSAFCIVIRMHTPTTEKWLLRHSRIRCNFHFAQRNLSPFIHTLTVDVIRHRLCRVRSYGCDFCLQRLAFSQKKYFIMENNASQHSSSCGTETTMTLCARNSTQMNECIYVVDSVKSRTLLDFTARHKWTQWSN